MIKDSKVVILGSAFFHLSVSHFFLEPLPVVLFAVFYIAAFIGLKLKVKLVVDQSENIKVASLITLITSLFGLLLNYQSSPLFMSYLILTLVAIPIGTSFFNKTSHLTFYCLFTLMLAVIFTQQVQTNYGSGIAPSFGFALGFVYLLSRRRIVLEQQEVRHKNELNKLIKYFPDILIKKIGPMYQCLNFQQFIVSPELQSKLNEMITKNESVSDSFQISDKYYDITISFSEDKETIIYLREVTDRIVQQRELDKNRLQLTNSSKLAALGEMAGGVAHEINNPLQILALSTEQMRVMLMNPNLESTRQECENLCDQMESTIERVNNIIKGMKLISRDGHQDAYEKVDVKDIVNETLSFCKEKFKNNGVKLYVYEEEGLTWGVNAQRVRLSQVILNILNNAFDAINHNNKKVIRVFLSKQDGNVKLAIADNGSGVPEEIIEKVFQPFFTTKELGKGTGLGLSISKGIIEQHNGKFYLDAEDRSKFIIEIPESKEVANG